MQAIALAPANIAFIKYWGRRNNDNDLRLPANSSISVNLSNVNTQTAVEFLHRKRIDSVKIDGELISGKERARVIDLLDKVRKRAGITLAARVESNNNFPRGTGLASSASGFAALTLAATAAAGLNLSERELSRLARVGSGSACRSIPSGFVEWKMGSTDPGSYAHSLYPPDYWDIRIIIAIVDKRPKSIGSSEGHTRVNSSPFFSSRLKGMPPKVAALKEALANRNFTQFGHICEIEALNMHSVMLTSEPALVYWQPATLRIIHAVMAWRSSDLECYFTIDAGPNVLVICRSNDAAKIGKRLAGIEGVLNVITNRPTQGAHLLQQSP